MIRRTWSRLLIALAILAALAALAYRSEGSVHLAGFSWSKLLTNLAETNKAYLLASVAAIYLAYLLRALRWKRFCRPLGACSLQKVWDGTMMGFTAMFVLGRPGEPVRPLLLARKCRLPVSSMFGIYVLERLFDTAATAVLAGISLVQFRAEFGANSNLEARIRAAGGFLLAALAAFGLLLLYFRFHGARFIESRLRRWRERNGWRRFLAAQLAGFANGLQALRTFSDWLAAASYSAVHWALIALIYLWVMRSLGGVLEQMNYGNAMLVLAFTMIGSLIQLPGVGGGAQVASFVALTRVFGVEPEPAAAAAVLTWIITFAGSTLVGIPLLIHEGLSMGDLRRLARAENAAEWAAEQVQLASSEKVAAQAQAEGGDGAQ